MNQQEAAREAQELRQTQAVKKTFDYVISFTAKAGQAGSVSIPINSDGDFHQLGYNIRVSKNSVWTHTVDGNTVNTNFQNVKLKFSSQTANGQQSNDFIPSQLIATPGSDSNVTLAPPPKMQAVRQKADRARHKVKSNTLKNPFFITLPFI